MLAPRNISPGLQSAAAGLPVGGSTSLRLSQGELQSAISLKPKSPGVGVDDSNTESEHVDIFARLSRHLELRVEDLRELCNLRCASDDEGAKQRLGALAMRLDELLTSVEQQLDSLEESVEKEAQLLERAAEVRAASSSQLEKVLQLHSLLSKQLDPPPPNPQSVSAFFDSA